MVFKIFRVFILVFNIVRPIFKDVMHIIKEVNSSELNNDEARKKVFQDITDFIQKNGMEKIPDSVLNCVIELCFQIYKWDNKK